HSRDHALTVDLQYSLSDRIRYYWPDPAIEQARQRLFDNLRANPPPIPLISQFLPHALHALRIGSATRDPLSLTMAHVSAALDDYHHACHDHDTH
ncbi:tagatose-bisphosphate aldolase, partial [Pseudomonas sp. GP01-A8]